MMQTDATVNKLLNELNAAEDFHLPNLKSLKLRKGSRIWLADRNVFIDVIIATF